MPLYRTSYTTPAGTLTTQCYAENDEHLIEVMRMRGMGETRADSSYPSSQPEMASTLLRERKFAAANHALVWASMIAARAQITDAWGLLNDYGLIHEMAHLLHQAEASFFGGVRVSEEFINRVAAFEMLVPGLHSCWAGEDKSAVFKDIYTELRERYYSGVELKSAAMRGYGKSIYDGVRTLARRSTLTGRTIHSIIYDDPIDLTMYLMDEGSMLKGSAARYAPSAKPGTREFERHQRTQGGAVKAQKKADLVAKMKANHEARVAKAKPLKLGVDFTPMNNAMQAIDRSARKAADALGKVSILTADFGEIEKRLVATLAKKNDNTRRLMMIDEEAMLSKGETVIVEEEQNAKPEDLKGHRGDRVIFMAPTGKPARQIANHMLQREIAERAMEMATRDLMETYPTTIQIHDELQLSLPSDEAMKVFKELSA